MPEIDSYEGLMHTLFALEDLYGLRISNIDGEICLALKKFDNPEYLTMYKHFEAWWQKAADMRDDKISKDQYDEWRYHYSTASSSGISAHISGNK